jgi:hypothetical protein
MKLKDKSEVVLLFKYHVMKMWGRVELITLLTWALYVGEVSLKFQRNIPVGESRGRQRLPGCRGAEKHSYAYREQSPAGPACCHYTSIYGLRFRGACTLDTRRNSAGERRFFSNVLGDVIATFVIWEIKHTSVPKGGISEGDVWSSPSKAIMSPLTTVKKHFSY